MSQIPLKRAFWVTWYFFLHIVAQPTMSKHGRNLLKEFALFISRFIVYELESIHIHELDSNMVIEDSDLDIYVLAVAKYF